MRWYVLDLIIFSIKSKIKIIFKYLDKVVNSELHNTFFWPFSNLTQPQSCRIPLYLPDLNYCSRIKLRVWLNRFFFRPRVIVVTRTWENFGQILGELSMKRNLIDSRFASPENEKTFSAQPAVNYDPNSAR